MNDGTQNQRGTTVTFVSHARALASLLDCSLNCLPGPLLSLATPGELEQFNGAVAHLQFQIRSTEVYISAGIRGDLVVFSQGRLILGGNGVKPRRFYSETVDPPWGAGPFQWWLRACTPAEAAEPARSGKPLAVLRHEDARGILYLEELCPQAVQLAAGLDNNGIHRKES